MTEESRRSLGDRWVTWGRSGEAERIRSILALPPDGSLLDVGGRTGAFTARIAPSRGNVVILEPDERSRRAGARRHPEFRFVEGQGEHLPFPDGCFDRVAAIRSTHHMGSPAEFLREAHRVLRDGGGIVLEELAPRSGLARLFGALAHRHDHARLDFRAPDDWTAALRSAGFRDVRSTGESRWYLVAGRR